MTLTADDSYLTVAEADELAGEDLGPEVDRWTALDPVADLATKEAALKRATREVDAFVATGWERYDPDQVLKFPREVDVDAAGDPYIPRPIRLATYQQAIYILSNLHELAAMNAHRARRGDADPDAAYGVDPDNGPALVCDQARHYLSGFRTGPRPGKGGGMGSTRVASGFTGTW